MTSREPPRPGDPAPPFSLPAAPGPDRVSLDELRAQGPVVVLFFPLAFSPTCTDEMCHLADDFGPWADLDAQVVGISVDSPWVNQRFARETGVPFPILSDFNREVAARYGVLYEEFYGMEGVSKRAAFVVDPAGRVTYAWVSEDAGRLPDFEAILEAVEGARAHG